MTRQQRRYYMRRQAKFMASEIRSENRKERRRQRLARQSHREKSGFYSGVSVAQALAFRQPFYGGLRP